MKKLTALLLATALLLGLAACGGDSSSASGGYAIVPPGASSVQDTSQAEEAPPEVVLNQAFLTGLEKGADYPEGKRVTAVMLNNVPGSRPQNGISEAQILVEIRVEYGVTRFMALYEDYATMPSTGGLRSARDQFFQLLIPYRGYYIHEGPSHPSHPVNVMIRDYEYQDYDLQATYGAIYNKDSSRSTSSYSWYNVTGDSVSSHINQRGLSDERNYGSPAFNFVSYLDQPRVPGAGAMPELTVIHNAGYRTYFEYDAGEGRYKMSMFNSERGGVEPTVDGNNGTQLGFENVLVLFAPMDIYPNTAPENLPKFDYSQGGYGYYFSQGAYEPLIWRKGAPDQALQLYSTDGSETPVYINTGKTYLSMVNDELLPEFDEVMRTGTAGEAAAAGEVDPNAAQPTD